MSIDTTKILLIAIEIESSAQCAVRINYYSCSTSITTRREVIKKFMTYLYIHYLQLILLYSYIITVEFLLLESQNDREPLCVRVTVCTHRGPSYNYTTIVNINR